jgi:HEAT repeat protein
VPAEPLEVAAISDEIPTHGAPAPVEPGPVSAVPPPAAPPLVTRPATVPVPARPQTARLQAKPAIWIAIAAVLVVGLMAGPPVARAVQFRMNASALTKADAPGRAAAARALAASQNPQALPLLAQAMADSDTQVRKNAQDGLLAFGPAAVDTCVSLLDNRDPVARSGAVEVAYRLADKRAIEPLCTLLKDDSLDAATRTSAIQAVTALGASASDATPVPYLTEAISDDDEDVRVAAIEGLAGFRDASSVGPLVAAFTTGGQRTSDAAAKTLEEIGSPAVYPLMVSTANPATSGRALSLVHRIGPLAGDQVVRAIGHSNPRVRLAAINTIAGYDYSGGSADSALIARLKNDRVPAVRIAAANALGRFESSAGGDWLFTILCKDGNKALRASAATALVKIRGGGDRALLYALRDRNTKAVAKLYKRFIKWGEPETLPIMSDAVVKHGFKSMVLAYLNCGNSRLDKAARRWCSRHGYRVVRRSGSGWGGARWGGY